MAKVIFENYTALANHAYTHVEATYYAPIKPSLFSCLYYEKTPYKKRQDKMRMSLNTSSYGSINSVPIITIKQGEHAIIQNISE